LVSLFLAHVNVLQVRMERENESAGSRLPRPYHCFTAIKLLQ